MFTGQAVKRTLILVLTLSLFFGLFVFPVAAASDKVFYNGEEYPTFNFDSSKYYYLIQYETNNPWLYEMDKPLSFGKVVRTGFVSSSGVAFVTYYVLNVDETGWEYHASENWNSLYRSDQYRMIWASADVKDNVNGGIYMAGSVPSAFSGTVTGISLNRTAAQMEKGSDYPIAIDVSGDGDFDPACTCVVAGNTSHDTYVYLDDSLNYESPNTFHLVIGADEMADTLTITATSVADPSVSATHTVALVDPVVPGITGIDLSRTQDWGKPGSGIYIYVDTVGVGTYNAACTCVVSGNTSADTCIVDLGGDAYPNRFYLIIGDNEMSPLVDITVTSIANPSVSACWTIELSEPGVPDPTDPPPPSEPDPTEPPATDPPSPSEPDPTEPTEPDFIEQGESILDELDDVIPDHTDDFSVVLQDFVESMSYEGTDCKFCFPAIIFPAIPGVIDGFQFNEEKEVDFAEFFAMFPDPVFSLVRLLLTAALIIYCVKELYDMIQYVMTMRGGGE